MYLIVFISIIISCLLGTMGGSFMYLLDFVSIIMITLLIVPTFLASGLGRELPSIIKLMGNSKLQFEAVKCRKMLLAVGLLIKLSAFSGVFTTILGAILTLRQLSDPSTLGANISVILISLFYSLFLCLILFPIQVKLKANLIDLE